MVRKIVMLGTVLSFLSVGLVARPAAACESEHAECKCHSHRAGSEKKKQDGKAAEQDLHDALAGKCRCESSADCTCKKGDCQCKNCGKHHSHQRSMVAPLKGKTDALPVPVKSRLDATAGAFI